MSTANFETMRDFSLFAKDYMFEVKRCPECGAIQDAENEMCEFCEADGLESIQEFDDMACSMEWDEITAEMNEFNRGLLFHELSMKSGYYYGVQFIVETEHDLEEYDYDNDECHYYFDCCRSVAYRKYAAEVRKINRWMAKLAKRYGFDELVCTARFSNGEAHFSKVSNPRARLYAAVAC